MNLLEAKGAEKNCTAHSSLAFWQRSPQKKNESASRLRNVFERLARAKSFQLIENPLRA